VNRRTRLAAPAGLIFVVAWAVIAVGATSEPEPQPTPPRVCSSCLAADTKPVPADDDLYDGR
jgi:hypothetical protein